MVGKEGREGWEERRSKEGGTANQNWHNLCLLFAVATARALVEALALGFKIDHLTDSLQVTAISRDWASRAALPQHVVQMVNNFPSSLHPMSQFSAGVTAMQSESKFAKAYSEGIPKTQYWEVREGRESRGSNGTTISLNIFAIPIFQLCMYAHAHAHTHTHTHTHTHSHSHTHTHTHTHTHLIPVCI